MKDIIEIRRLKVMTRIGVPEEERAELQPLWITVKMAPSQGFHGLGDAILKTVDYHAVALEIERIAEVKPRHLIETLALEIADRLLSGNPLGWVAVTVEKQILPNAELVAVHLERSRD